MIVAAIRHGETDFNRQKRFQGQKYDLPLNTIGRLQAERLVPILIETIKEFRLKIDTVAVSPLQRAKQTYDILASSVHTIAQANLIIADGLKEVHLGHWEGQKIREAEKEIRALEKNALGGQNMWHAPKGMQIPGGEHTKNFRERVLKTFEELKSNTKGDLCLISHGVVTAYLLQHFIGYIRYRGVHLKNCCLMLLEIREGSTNLIHLNNLAHLAYY